MQISVKTARIILRYLERSIPRGRTEEEELAHAINEIQDHLKPKKGTK